MSRIAATTLAISLLSVPAAAQGSGMIDYYCINPKPEQGFVLSYEQRGESISRVAVHALGMPRLGSDLETHWRAKRAGTRVDFSFSEISKGLKVKGSMTLIPSSQSGHYGLIWRTQYSGGGAAFEDELGRADCVIQNTNDKGAKPQ